MEVKDGGFVGGACILLVVDMLQACGNALYC